MRTMSMSANKDPPLTWKDRQGGPYSEYSDEPYHLSALEDEPIPGRYA